MRKYFYHNSYNYQTNQSTASSVCIVTPYTPTSCSELQNSASLCTYYPFNELLGQKRLEKCKHGVGERSLVDVPETLEATGEPALKTGNIKWLPLYLCFAALVFMYIVSCYVHGSAAPEATTTLFLDEEIGQIVCRKCCIHYVHT